MNKSLVLVLILFLSSCGSGKSEYISSVSNINSLINEYWKEEGEVSREMINVALDDFSMISDYRTEHQSEILGLEKKSSKVITEIDKLRSLKYKNDNIDKLFQDTRHDIMESLYNIKFEINRSLFSDRAYAITENQLKYMQQYDIEFRSLVNQ